MIDRLRTFELRIPLTHSAGQRSGGHPKRFNYQIKTPPLSWNPFHDQQTRLPKSSTELLKPTQRQSKLVHQWFGRPVLAAENFSCSLRPNGLRWTGLTIQHRKTRKKPPKTLFQNGVWNYLKESCIWHLAKSKGYTILCLLEVNTLRVVSFLLANFWSFKVRKIVGKSFGFLLDLRWQLPMNA